MNPAKRKFESPQGAAKKKNKGPVDVQEEGGEDMANDLARMKEIFPDLPTNILKDKLREGKGFGATVELLLQYTSNKGEDKSINEADDSVIIISGEEESPAAQMRSQRRSLDEDIEHGIGLSRNEERCLQELREVVAAVSGVVGSSSSSGGNKDDALLLKIARSKPVTEADLMKIVGVTKAWCRRFQDAVLEVTKDYAKDAQQQIVRESSRSSQDAEELGNDLADISFSLAGPNATLELEEAGDQSVDGAMATLTSILPEVDPTFLRTKALEIGGNPDKLEQFIAHCLDRKSSLPSRKERDAKEAIRKQAMAIRKLGPKNFVEEFEDPHAHFMKVEAEVGEKYREHCMFYIVKHFPAHSRKQIDKVLEKNKGHFLPSIKDLQAIKKGKQVVGNRENIKKPDVMDMNFLKEYVYFKLEDKIRKYQAKVQERRELEVIKAKKCGAVFECQVCYDPDGLLKEVAMCAAGCMICRDCVKRGASVAIGDSKTTIECLAGCGQMMEEEALRKALPAAMLDKLLQKRQLEEVEAAGLEDLEKCPACNYATVIQDPGIKVLVCGNPECGKETCRECKEESHMPLACHEVERDEEVRARTELENVATEAMIRQCAKCKNRFFKEEGCNKMKCPKCGQSMCYLCRIVVPDNYAHFYGQGGQAEKGKCPLWSDNANLHRDEVVKAVEAAKKKIDPTKLKHDPSKNLEKPPAGYNRNQVEEPGSGDEEDEDDDDDENDYDSDFDDGGFYVRDSDEDDDEGGYRVLDWW